MSQRKTDHGQRVAMVERHLKGEALQTIAKEMGLNYYTARTWWRAYQKGGWAALVPKAVGVPGQGALSRFGLIVRYVALRLKREHPAWGLELILLHLSRRSSLQGQRLPKRSVLGAYYQQFAPRLKEHRPLLTRRPKPAAQAQVEAVHQCWQIDFKGEEVVPGVGLVKPFIVCDKFSGALLAGIIHAQGPLDRHKVSLTSRQAQQDLRQVFSQWGLPDQIQMDRDPVWIGSARLEWPGTLLLWLVGLAIEPIINRPHCPTDNAQVERGNRTWDEHVCIGAKPQSAAQLQAATDQAWHDRRCHLPSRNPTCHRLPPMVAHPQLAWPRRPFDPAQEAILFDISRVETYLAQWLWHRKVDTQGCISMAHLNRRISNDHIGQLVKIRFEPDAHLFIASAVDGTELRRFTLPVITADYILGLEPNLPC